MKIETQPRDDHQVKLVVELEPELLEKYRHQAARNLSQETKIPGFRPGKAPYPVVVRQFGLQNITERAIDLMIDEVYPEILKEADIKPGGPGNIEEVVSLDPPKFSFIVPLEASVDLGDWRSVRQDYTPPEVSDEDVEKFIANLRRNYGTLEPVERPAQDDDLVYLTLSGVFTQPEEGQDAEAVKERPMQLLIHPEADQFIGEYPFQGFGRMLIGLSAGEEKDITYAYPAEYPTNEALAGKEVKFHIKVDSIKFLKLPELDEEFAQQLGAFESVEALKQAVREQLEHTGLEDYDRNYYMELVDKIRAQATLKYPPQSVEQEVEEVIHSTTHNLERQGMDFETYLKTRQMTREEFIEKEARQAAINRLERGLVMDEIARAESIQLDVDRLQQMVTQTMLEIQSDQNFQRQRRKVNQQRLTENVTYEAASSLMNQQILDRLKAIATGKADEQPTEATGAEATATDTTPAVETTAGEAPQDEAVATGKVKKKPAQRKKSVS